MMKALGVVMTVGGAVLLILGILGVLGIGYYGLNPWFFVLIGVVLLVVGILLHTYKKHGKPGNPLN